MEEDHAGAGVKAALATFMQGFHAKVCVANVTAAESEGNVIGEMGLVADRRRYVSKNGDELEWLEYHKRMGQDDIEVDEGVDVEDMAWNGLKFVVDIEGSPGAVTTCRLLGPGTNDSRALDVDHFSKALVESHEDGGLCDNLVSSLETLFFVFRSKLEAAQKVDDIDVQQISGPGIEGKIFEYMVVATDADFMVDAHPGFACDYCYQAPIRGNRYNVDELDLCPACWNRQEFSGDEEPEVIAPPPPSETPCTLHYRCDATGRLVALAKTRDDDDETAVIIDFREGRRIVAGDAFFD